MYMYRAYGSWQVAEFLIEVTAIITKDQVEA